MSAPYGVTGPQGMVPGPGLSRGSQGSQSAPYMDSLDVRLFQDRAPLCERVIAGFSGHIPGLRNEAIVGYNFKDSVNEAERARPRPGMGMEVPHAVVKPMPPKSHSHPDLAPVPEHHMLNPLSDQISHTRVVAGYSGHIPGKQASAWRWIGKPHIRAVNFNETFDNPWRQQQLKDMSQQLQGMNSDNPHGPRDDSRDDKGVLGYSNTEQNGYSYQPGMHGSWRSNVTGVSWAQAANLQNSRQNFNPYRVDVRGWCGSCWGFCGFCS
jgi:hypothetical protein